MAPNVLLPYITCRAEFVQFFLNSLRDWTAAAWSSRNISTPLKANTPVASGKNLAGRSFQSTDCTPVEKPDQLTMSSSRISTPDSVQRLESRFSSAQRLNSAKTRLHGSSPSFCSPQDWNTSYRHIHNTKQDSARHRPLRQHNVTLHAKSSTPIFKDRQGRALFLDSSATGGSRKSSGKHKTPVGNRVYKLEEAPVPSFNLDSNVDFPDMKSSQRYYL